MDIRQVLRKRKDGSLVLDFPIWFRVALAIIAAVMTALMIWSRRIFVLPLVFAVVTALGALYTQGFLVHPERGVVTRRHGLVFLAQSTSYPISTVEAVVLERFSRGMTLRADYVRLKLRFVDKNELVLDVQKLQNSEVIPCAVSIGAALHVPVIEDRGSA
jgi:hypothetical protein